MIPTNARKARRRRPFDPVAFLAVPAIAYLLFVYALPLLWLLLRSVIGPKGFTLEPIASFFADPFNWRVMANTLKIAGLVALVCLLVGYPTAFALAWARGWVQVVLLAAIILPLSIGVVVKAFAWQIVLRRDGIVSSTMVGLGLWDEPVRLLFTETGLVLGAANVFLPFMILPVYSVVKLSGFASQRSGRNVGGDAVLSIPAHHAAADTAGCRYRHRVRLFALRFHVRHPESSDRRPLPDARDAHGPIFPADAK